MSRLNLGDSLILDNDIVVNDGEVKTGATWGGKPIYAKAVSGITAATANAAVTFSIGNVSMSTCVSMKGIINSSNGYSYTINHYNGTTGHAYTQINRISGDGSIVVSGSYLLSQPFFVVVYYTKTTD